ncbi:MAG: hypothetical protein GX494_08555 [Clostridiaceae bacterium]|nr:hypothetical protein [Clostridiaceae bacterium]
MKRYRIKIRPVLLALAIAINIAFGIYNIYTPVVQGDAKNTSIQKLSSP